MLKKAILFAILVVLMLCMAIGMTSCKIDVEIEGESSDFVTPEESNLETQPCSHIYGEAVVEKEPTENEKGQISYKCTLCGDVKREEFALGDHIYSTGNIIKDATLNEEGLVEYTCLVCGEVKKEILPKLPATYIITIKDQGELRLDETGVYDLGTPQKTGYKFIKWVDAKGKDFATSGKVSANVTVSPVYEIIPTTTVEQLEQYAAAGAEKILIDADIVIDRPIHIVDSTTIYAKKNVKLTRNTKYLGDIFVVGIDKDEVPATLLNKSATLTLDGTNGKITIDGNRDNMTKTVVGSAVFITDSGIVNMYDGVTIANNYKDGNERAYICTRWVGQWMADRAGGAAVLILNGSFNMYGGVIENNRVRCERTIFTTAEGVESWSEDAGCGGAVYNCGNFNMFGGTIRNNEGLYGGAVYNDEIARLVSGTISGNTSYSKGGAVASSVAIESEIYIGTDKDTDKKMIFSDNVAQSGGALYSNTDSPIVIAGNTVFKNNTSANGGGAIYTAGGLSVKGTLFDGNNAPNGGGAIYFYSNYRASAKKDNRDLELSNCTFLRNQATLGGAITLSASDEARDNQKGAYAKITNCVFDGNTANNCGALYITRYGKAEIVDSVFENNTSTGMGGAVSVQAECTLSCENVTFENNSAASAGALYLYDSKRVSLKNVNFIENNATEGNGGAIYFNAITLNLDSSVTFKDNSALNHGGAIYASYITNADQTLKKGNLIIDGSVFEKNTALYGGAISARTANTLTIKNASFKDNSTLRATVGTDQGGGAIYSDFSAVTINDTVFDGGKSGYYGGTLKLYSCNTTLSSTTFKNGSGGTGAALYIDRGSFTATDVNVNGNASTMNGVVYLANLTATFNNLKAKNNTAVSGGVFYVSGANTVLNLVGGELKSNSATNGGVVYANEATVSVSEKVKFEENEATYGGAIYAVGDIEVTVENSTFKDNKATADGGAIYAARALVTVIGNTTAFTGNNAKRGGAIYLTNQSVENEQIGATLSMTNGEFKNNSAIDGGAVSIRSKCTATFTSTCFIGNTVSGLVDTADGNGEGGGAIYVGWATLNLDSVVMSGNNAADGFGGAVNAFNSTVNVSGKIAIADNTSGKDQDKTICNIYLSSGKKITVVGIVEEGSNIGVTAANGAFAEVDGTNVTDVSVYREFFTSDESKPVYVNNGMLYIGLTVIQQPSTFNDFTVESTADTHKWYLATDTDRENVVCEGKTLTGVEEGKNYVCVMSFGSYSIDSNTVTYYTKQTHSVCGAECGHSGAHEELVYIPIYNATDLKAALEGSGGNYYLACDVEISSTITTTAAVNLCLNGKILSAKAGTSAFTMIRSKGTLTITDCTQTEREGYIDPATGLWSDGVYSGEGSAEAVTLKGGIIMGGHGSWGGAINATAALEIYNINFVNNSATSGAGAVYIEGAFEAEIHNVTFVANIAVADGGGAIYLKTAKMTADGDNKFIYNKSGSHGGAVYVLTSATLNMTGGAFKNNVAQSSGGAVSVRSGGKVNFTSTVFDSNSASGTATNQGGGAVCVSWATATFNSVTMTNNTVSSGYGGAINVDNNQDSLTVTGGSFQNNSALYGGAIHLTSNDAKTATVKNVTFTSNEATYGGAIYVSNAMTVNVENSTFNNNVVANDGGAIYSTKAKINISGNTTEFTSNSAKRGGAIYLVDAANATMVDGSFRNNTASTDGGAVSLRTGCTANFTSTVFDSNSASGTAVGQGGGAVYAGSATLTLNSVTMTNNTVNSGYGNAINCNNSTLNVKGKVVIYNNDIYLTSGKLITIVGALESGTKIRVTVTNGAFATGDGTVTDISAYREYFVGASDQLVYEKEGKLYATSLIVQGPTTFNNYTVESTADTYKWYLATDTDRENVVCEGKTLTGVEEGKNYVCVMSFGSYSIDSNTVTYYTKQTHSVCGAECGHSGAHEELVYIPIYNATDLKAALEGSGGNYYLACDVEISSTITTTAAVNLCLNGKILSAKAGTSAFTMIRSKGTLTITDCTQTEREGYIDPATGLWSDGVYSGEGSAEAVTLKGGIIMGGHGSWGGAINATAALEIYNINFVNNSATSGAGAVYIEGAFEAEIHNVTFVANIAVADGGGAIYLKTAKMTADGDNKFIYNKSGSHGGAVYVLTSATLNMTGGAFKNNVAQSSGGAVSVRSGGKVNFTSTVFDSNSASGTATNQGGGAVCVSWATATFNSVTMTNNTVSSGYGGAINVDNNQDSLTVTGGSFQNNSALYGGAIHLTSNNAITATVKNVTFTSNKAMAGGAISANGKQTVNVENCTFTKNEASGGVANSDRTACGGGAIYVSQTSTVNVAGGSFNSNNSLGTTYDDSAKIDAGGAIMVDGGTFNANGTTFNDNTSKTAGGAIGCSHLKTTAMLIENCDFNNNVASNNGGAIFIQNYEHNEKIVISDCVFAGNSTSAAGSSIYVRTNGSATIKNITTYGGSNASWDGANAIYATSGTHIIFEGSVKLTDDEGGSADKITAKAKIIVRYTTEEEKNAWTAVITGGGTITYEEIPAQQ